jgi:hypothetical protein
MSTRIYAPRDASFAAWKTRQPSSYRAVGGNRISAGDYSAPRSSVPATEKQVAFILKLAAERGRTDITSDKCQKLTKSGASDVIEGLLAIKVAKPTAAPRQDRKVAVTEAGLYEYESGKVAEVVISRSSGRPYAKAVNLETGDLDYVASLIFKLQPEQRIMLARAQELGRISGRCVRCRARLDDPKSVAAGIGPVCRKYQGWAA